MEDTIFTKIIKGEIPSHKIYEDERTFAFLDINPATEGHTLVIPKTQVEFIWDLDDADYQALMVTVQKVGRRLREWSPRQYVGQVVIGTDVPHAHIHVAAFDHAGELKRAFDSERTSTSQGLAAIAEELRFS